MSLGVYYIQNQLFRTNMKLSVYFLAAAAPSMDLASFSPVPSLLGGLVIGGCSVAYMVLTGQVLGLSGKIRGLFMDSFNNNFPFVMGLAAGGAVIRLTAPSLLQALPSVTEPGIPARMVVGGLAVGLGTAMANGCTSGHGLTGLSRFSLRSFGAVCTFMASAIGFGTLFGSSQAFPPVAAGIAVGDPALAQIQSAWMAFGAVLACMLLVPALHSRGVLPQPVALGLAKFFALTGFGMGLCLSGMAMPGKLAGFLDLHAWDPSLFFVLGGAHLLKTPLMQLWVRVDAATDNRPRPVFAKEFACRGSDRTTVDLNLVGGSAIFGLGWALTGLCPGPAIICVVAPPSIFSGEMASALLFNVCFIAGGCMHKCLLKEALLWAAKKSN